MRILIIGESCKDVFHYGECKRLCPDAPVPVFKTINIVENYGMAKNVQKNLSSLAVETEIITNSNYNHITKTRFVDLRSNHMFLRVDENDDSYDQLNEDTLDNIDFHKYDAVIVSDYDKGFINTGLLKKISISHPLTFLDTKKILGDWSDNFTFIKINNKEYEDTKHTIGENLRKKLIITRGPHGSEFQNKIYPVDSVEVKDTSGAGDTFISALCFKYVETSNIHVSIKFANDCATKVVQKRGVSII